MYDPNPAFIRQIEVYRALNPTLNVRVYFAIFENSVEEQNYLSLIRKEKQSFEKLIHEKSVNRDHHTRRTCTYFYTRLWLFQ